MDMKEEMMNDAIDDVIGDEEDDEERLVLDNFLWEPTLEPPQDVVIFNNDFVASSPLTIIITGICFSLRAKCWLREG